MKLFFLIISFCLFSLLKVYSQDMRFKHITDDDGLISNQVNAILQDSDGFMWFGTNNGLCRFDGYSFLNFFYSPTDSQSLSNNSITSLIEDKNHNIWIGTRDGLNMLNRETYKIKRLAFAFNDKSKSLSISSLVMNGDDKLWVGTNYSGLFSFDINNHQIVNYIHLSQNPLSITDNSVNCILEDKERGLFIGTVNGLDLFDPTTSTFKRILPDVDIRCLKHFNDSSIFVGVIAEGNNYYKLTADDIIEKKELPVQFTDKLTLFLLDSDGNQWMSIRDNGIIYTDAHNHQIRRLLFDKYKPEGINSNTITTFYEDRLGNIWIGTFDAGINVFEKNRKAFIHVKDNFLTNGLQNNRVRSIYQDSEGDIWIGTKIGGALSKFDRKTLSFTHYRHDPKNPFSLSDDLILCITDDRPGYLWVGTSNGLNLFEKKTGKSKIFLHDPKNPNTINSNIIYALLKDGDQLFIGNVIRGLDIYNTKQNTVEHYLSSNEPGSISNNRVRVLYNDSKDNIWIGTENGLNLYNKTTKDFTHFLNDPADTNSLSDNTIQCIHEDGNQNLWIGTSSGFNLMNRQNKTFKRFTTEDGLSGNSICGILNDSKGNLWISTNNGISKFNPETKVFKNYNVYDGLQANEFSLYAYCGTKEGEMLFGGNNGFTMFNPEQITDNKIIPEVIITGFKLFNKEVSVGAPESPLKKHITQSKEITLTHNQSVISFEYVALNYSTPEKNQYAYMMEGFDPSADGWNYVGTKREATYTNLDPGDYIFRVKASNNDGLWNKKGTSIKITILPPWWKTTLFRVLAVLFFIAVIYGIYRYILNDLRKQKLKLEQKVNERTEELQLQKNQLHTIIENIPDPIYYKDRDSRFVVCNSALAKTFDLSYEDVIGKTDFDFHDKEDALKYFDAEQELMRNGVSIFNLEEHNPYNENKKIKNIEWLLITKVPVRDSVGNVIGMIGINRDITIQKQIQQSLRESEKKLNIQKKSLEDTNTLKDKFFSILAHDLKNPFGSMLGFLELIKSDYDRFTEEEKIHMLGIAIDSAQHISNLIENLLHWSRSQRGLMPFQPERIILHELVGAEVALLKSMISKKGIELSLEYEKEDLDIVADKNMLSMILRNLISNAIKFTNPGGKISVRIRNSDNSILFEIADTGMGIPEEVVDKLFQIDLNFNRQGTANEKGTGLGLVLCHEFVETHHGKIWAKSEVGVGTTFYFTIPQV